MDLVEFDSVGQLAMPRRHITKLSEEWRLNDGQVMICISDGQGLRVRYSPNTPVIEGGKSVMSATH